MKRRSALPIWVQVATLAVFAVVMSQAVAFGVVVLSPEPRPAGFSVEQAALALKGEPARTGDGRPLIRRLSGTPLYRGERPDDDPMSAIIKAGIVRQLGVPQDRVQVDIDRPPRRAATERQNRVFVSSTSSTPRIHVSGQGQLPPDGSAVSLRSLPTDRIRSTGREMEGAQIAGRIENFTILTDRINFAPFSAAVRLENGQWAVVQPPRGWLAPWQKNLLLGFAISMLLLSPLVWWMGRRLTRPIRVFADAAERLGANPDAEPLPATGPSEVRTAIHAFNDMQASLRDHVRKRTQTVAAIAHDLRTPLTRLRFRAEQAPEAVRDRMAADIEEMDALIAQAMAYVRGEMPSERRERFDLGDLTADCVQGFAETGADVIFVRRDPLDIEGDPAALRRALANLIGNAVKFAGAARVTAEVHEGRPIVRVEDEGAGLPPDELEAVFEPFHRGEKSRNRDTGGTGLGLTVARQAARAHGGDVIIRNRPGGGLEAVLTVEAASAA